MLLHEVHSPAMAVMSTEISMVKTDGISDWTVKLAIITSNVIVHGFSVKIRNVVIAGWLESAQRLQSGNNKILGM